MPIEQVDTLYPTHRMRPTKISIVGAGAVGTALAYACVISSQDRKSVV